MGIKKQELVILIMKKLTKEERKNKVLVEARSLLVEEGYANFSMRTIARRTGMHLKTLQHYFPSKADLLNELMDYVLREYYESQYENIARIEKIEIPEAKLNMIMKFTLEDSKSESTSKFFSELWALAQREGSAKDALDRIYSRHCELIESLICEINPAISKTKVSQRATMVAATIEGVGGLFIGHGKKRYPHYEGIEDEICRNLMLVVKAP